MNIPLEERSVMFNKEPENKQALNPALLNMENSANQKNVSLNVGITKSSVKITPTIKTEGATFTPTVTLDKNKGISSLGGTVRVQIGKKKKK